jgi:hypothetical protein
MVKLEIEETNEIFKAYKHQLVALYWLLAVVTISFFGLQVPRYSLVINYNYSLHEILSATANILFLVPIALLIYVYLGLKYLRLRGLGLPKLKSAIKAIIVMTSIIGMLAISVYQLNDVTTIGVILVEDKIQEENSYYLIINDKKVRVSENEFYLIEINLEYTGSYRWNSLSPGKGKLLTIRPD